VPAVEVTDPVMLPTDAQIHARQRIVIDFHSNHLME
jgi:hypothetical protein